MYRHKLFVFSVFVFLVGCGGETNLNKYWDADADAKDDLYVRAKFAYDQGNYEEAASLAERIQQFNPNNLEASILLGYIYLSQAELDPIELARKLITSTSTSTTKLMAPSEDATTDSSGLTSVLANLQNILSLTDADTQYLVESMDTKDSVLPVPVPTCAEDARQGPILAKLNKIVTYICPYIADDVRVSTDSRHNCRSKNVRNQQNQANLLWAFAHLSEALAFNSVLMYTSEGSSTVNLQARVNKLSSIQDPVSAVTSITDTASLFSKVFPISQSDSTCATSSKSPQLWSMVNNLKTVNLAFSKISGIPSSITSSLKKALTDLENVSASGASVASAERGVIKEKLTKDMVSKMTQQMNTLNEKATAGQITLTTAQKQSMCSSFDTLTTGYQTAVTKPTMCN